MDLRGKEICEAGSLRRFRCCGAGFWVGEAGDGFAEDDVYGAALLCGACGLPVSMLTRLTRSGEKKSAGRS